MDAARGPRVVPLDGPRARRRQPADLAESAGALADGTGGCQHRHGDLALPGAADQGCCACRQRTGVAPEYVLAAERYFGAERGKAWVAQVGAMFSHMARISVEPEWVGLLDFESRFPGAIEAASSRQP
jgi:hypothetical protein